MAKYNFSITTPEGETLEVTNCDSFDEAINKVEKGLYDRRIMLMERNQKPATAAHPVDALLQSPPAALPKDDEDDE